MQANYANALCHLNATPLNKAKMGQCLGGGLLSLSLVARTFWHTKFFKRFIFGLLRPFCHFEPLQKGEKSTKIKRKLAIIGYFANAQYNKFGLLSKNNGYFHSKFKAFYKFISNFKPYARLFHIFTPNFLYFHSNRFQNFEKSYSTKDKQ